MIRHLALIVSCAALAVLPAAAAELVPWKGGATPALDLKDVTGRQHRLEDYRGQVVLINFWATWCEPCRAEMPSMQRLKEKTLHDPIVVLTVNVGEFPERINEFFQKYRIELTALRDHNSAAMKAWNVGVLPTSFIVGPDGRIRYRVVGEADWADNAMTGTLKSLMK